MGSGSSKNRQPGVIPVHDAVNHSMQTPPSPSHPHQQSPLQLQRQRQEPIGRTGLGITSSADNSIHFVISHNVTNKDYEVKFDDDNERTEEVPATQFNFFFIRHAKSCANEEVYFNKYIKKYNLSDPFISNDGIFATLTKRAEYQDLLQKRNPDHYFCSPLGRTWYTAKVLLPDYISKFQIAPHLREDEYGVTNNPYPYETNVKRFEFFKKYAQALTKTTIDVQGTPPGYALMNKASGAYGSDFIDEVGIAKFIEWYIKNENILGRNKRRVRNVVVVCHSDIIKKFCNDHLSREQLIARGMEQQGNSDKDWFFKKTHNYCVQVQVEMKVPQGSAALPPAIGTLAIEASGGKKHIKTKRRKSIKSNNKSNDKLNNNFKKSRIRKQRGGMEYGLEYKPETAAPPSTSFNMEIFIAIEGTRDYKRDESKKQDDCICNPDAYMDQYTAIKCAKEKGAQELEDFKSRQSRLS